MQMTLAFIPFQPEIFDKTWMEFISNIAKMCDFQTIMFEGQIFEGNLVGKRQKLV